MGSNKFSTTPILKIQSQMSSQGALIDVKLLPAFCLTRAYVVDTSLHHISQAFYCCRTKFFRSLCPPTSDTPHLFKQRSDIYGPCTWKLYIKFSHLISLIGWKSSIIELVEERKSRNNTAIKAAGLPFLYQICAFYSQTVFFLMI